MFPKYNSLLELWKSPIIEQFIYNIENNNGNSASYFFPFFNSDIYQELFSDYQEKIPDTPSNLLKKWIMFCYSIQKKFLSPQSELQNSILQDFSLNFSIKSLGQLQDKNYSILSSQNQNQKLDSLSSSQVNSFIKSLLSLNTTKNPLFYSLYSKILPFLQDMTSMQIHQSIGSKSLFLYYKTVPSDFFDIFEKIYKTKPKDFGFQDLLNYCSSPVIYQYTDFFHKIQNYIESFYHFPLTFPSIQNPLHFTTVNTCILKKKHFLDLWNSEICNTINDNEFSTTEKICDSFLQAIPYILVANYELISSKLSTISKYHILVHNYPNSLASDLCKRFYNDEKLIEMIFSLSKNKVEFSALSSNSIPYFLQSVLHQPQIRDFSNKLYYIYSDE